MSKATVGKKVPEFTLPATNEQNISLSDYKGKNIVLYFYPKDNTPGCTTESNDFKDFYAEFEKLNTVVLGISRDSLASHDKFKCKFDFPFELLSDTEETVCEIFDVIKMKNMYGKKVRGIERSTFLIDKSGTLVQEWRKVKVDGHVQEVLSALNPCD